MLAAVGLGTVACGVTGGEMASLPDVTEPAPPPPATRTTEPTPPPAAQANDPMPAAQPVRITIPTLDVTAPIMKLGLQPDGSLEVPPGADRAGWYTGSPTPGELGPAIIAAHINWNGEWGPFADLPELEPGDRVRVARADGTTAVFAITRVEQYDKDAFHTQEVYGDIDHAGLRLITCGGEFNEAADSYKSNIVAYARLVQSIPPPA